MLDYNVLAQSIKTWGGNLGLRQVGIAGIHLNQAAQRLQDWLEHDYHGDMEYMARHGDKRARPAELVPGTQRVIMVGLNYLPAQSTTPLDSSKAAIACYTWGRDYHRLLRRRLKLLVERIQTAIGTFAYRVFVDSAPVMEKPLAEQAGLGWLGKSTNLIQCRAGSWFFLGAIYTDLPLPIDTPAKNHCGRCQACLNACPTGALIAPYQLDARRCIAYLTLEYKGAIPATLRPLLGNRIAGCDVCQQVCPWNQFADLTRESAFLPRHGLDNAVLTDLFAWDAATFLIRTEGSALRRIGYSAWLRNIAVALGNTPATASVITALTTRINDPDPLVREHTRWALAQHSI